MSPIAPDSLDIPRSARGPAAARGVKHPALSPLLLAAFAGLLVLSAASIAAVLPEERADLLYHKYDGGGAEIDGPSLLVRKNLGDKVSVGLNHYVDNVTSASIDVLVSASEYTEKREENSLFVDYLRQKTSMSLGYTQSQ